MFPQAFKSIIAHISCFLLSMTPKSLNVIEFAVKLRIVKCQMRTIGAACNYFFNSAFLSFKIWLNRE